MERFNEVLRSGDLLYHLGDVGWSSFPVGTGFLNRLNTKEVFLILGNHDKEAKMKQYPFRWIRELTSLSIDKQQVILCHYAMRTWRNKGHGAFQLYGHSHAKLPGLGRQMDVGVDTHGFRPWAWEEIRDILGKIPYSPIEEEEHENS